MLQDSPQYGEMYKKVRPSSGRNVISSLQGSLLTAVIRTPTLVYSFAEEVRGKVTNTFFSLELRYLKKYKELS